MMDYAYAPVLGAVVGLLVGLTGIGGGAVMAPALLLVFGLDIKTVIATDLLFATITKFFTGSAHVYKERVDWPVTKKLWFGSIPATLIVLFYYFLSEGYSRMLWLQFLMGIMIFISGFFWLYSTWLEGVKSKKEIDLKERNILTIFFGAIIGLVTSLTSVGAGSFGAVVLRWLYAKTMNIKTLIATEVVHAIPVAFVAGIGFLIMGKTDLTLLGHLLMGSIPAAFVAGFFIERVPANFLKKMLGVILILVAIKLIAKTIVAF